MFGPGVFDGAADGTGLAVLEIGSESFGVVFEGIANELNGGLSSLQFCFGVWLSGFEFGDTRLVCFDLCLKLIVCLLRCVEQSLEFAAAFEFVEKFGEPLFGGEGFFVPCPQLITVEQAALLICLLEEGCCVIDFFLQGGGAEAEFFEFFEFAFDFGLCVCGLSFRRFFCGSILDELSQQVAPEFDLFCEGLVWGEVGEFGAVFGFFLACGGEFVLGVVELLLLFLEAVPGRGMFLLTFAEPIACGFELVVEAAGGGEVCAERSVLVKEFVPLLLSAGSGEVGRG